MGFGRVVLMRHDVSDFNVMALRLMAPTNISRLSNLSPPPHAGSHSLSEEKLQTSLQFRDLYRSCRIFEDFEARAGGRLLQ